jgi:hypothetical protein
MSVFCDRVPPEAVVVDGSTLEDVCSLLVAVGEFASTRDREAANDLLGFADPNLLDKEVVRKLLGFADPHLSTRGLAVVARYLSARLHLLIEEAR